MIDTVEAFARLAIEHWKVLRQFERALNLVPPDRRSRYISQIKYSTSRLPAILEAGGLNLVVLDGRQYQPELPAVVVNEEEAVRMSNPVVAETVEPAIVQNGRVVSLGKVALKEGKTL
jgi:hypothetical protein